MEVLSQDEVLNYIRSRKFRDGQVLVETAICDNLKGWSNFSDNVCSPSNVCLPRATGMMPYFFY
jgi:hypothetical protein